MIDLLGFFNLILSYKKLLSNIICYYSYLGCSNNTYREKIQHHDPKKQKEKRIEYSPQNTSTANRDSQVLTFKVGEPGITNM